MNYETVRKEHWVERTKSLIGYVTALTGIDTETFIFRLYSIRDIAKTLIAEFGELVELSTIRVFTACMLNELHYGGLKFGEVQLERIALEAQKFLNYLENGYQIVEVVYKPLVYDWDEFPDTEAWEIAELEELSRADAGEVSYEVRNGDFLVKIFSSLEEAEAYVDACKR